MKRHRFIGYLIFVFVALIAMAGVMQAQRPVRTVQNNAQNQQVRLDRNNNTVHTGAPAHEYTYTIDEMSIPNVSVMDGNVSVQYQKSDRIKVLLPAGTDDVTYYVYDANNQAILKNCIKGSGGTFNFNFQPGEYRLQIIDRKGAERNYRIVKR